MEIWKQVPWWASYEVSNKGRIKSLSNDKLRKEKIRRFSELRWYKRVLLSNWWIKKAYGVHRLVYLTFNGIQLDTKKLILHKNDKPWDNRLENLFIWTAQDNMDDMKKKWRWWKMHWEHSWINKLKEKDVRKIVQLLDKGIMHKDIAKQYNVNRYTITAINTWKNWNHLTNRYATK